MPTLTGFQDPFPTLYANEEKVLGSTPTSDSNYKYKIRKAWILEWARDSYTKLIGWPAKPFDVVTSGLADGADYDMSPSTLPKYFTQKEFHASNSKRKPTIVATSYTYKNVSGYKDNYWVDFANIRLGGGAFNNGLAQEETMVLEMPELANAVASPNGYFTRKATEGTGEGVREGSPRPLVILNVNRVVHLTEPSPKPTDRYWWVALGKDDLHKYVQNLTKDTYGRNLNILAMAAPDLRKQVGGKSFSGTELEVIQDLFNTFVAGFEKACGHAPQTDVPADQKVVVHTGGIGTGIFNNDPVVVYALQCLAAHHVGGVDLTYYMASSTAVTNGQKAYEDILAAIKKGMTVEQVLEVAHNVLKH